MLRKKITLIKVIVLRTDFAANYKITA